MHDTDALPRSESPAMSAQTEELAGRRFIGPFSVDEERGTLVLAGQGSGFALFFSGVADNVLPARLGSVRVRAAPVAGADGRTQFEVMSDSGNWTVAARSLQVHERAQLYGKVIRLPRFELRRRLLWQLLLRVARYRFGQALIRRVTGRN